MSTIETAFPHHDCGNGAPLEGGMTLRDYFAGQSLAGLVRIVATDVNILNSACAKICYELADAMLEARAK